jgi:diguanylate cyclase (GGDEF)-like protein/PAS domain S-box-containing protein
MTMNKVQLLYGTDPEVLAERWRLARGGSPLGAFELGRSGDVVSSDELDELCGLGGGDTISSIAGLVEHIHVEDRAAVLNTLRSPVGIGSVLDVQCRLNRLDDEPRPVRIRGTWVGLPTAPVLAAVVLDCVEDEAARLSDLAVRYRTLAEVSPDIIVVHQAGKVVYVNPAAVAHIRAEDANQLIGQPILSFFSPESRQAFLDRMSTMAETRSVAAFFEEKLIALDGTVVEIEATSILTSWEGRPAFQAVARVITERKAAEAAQAALEERYSAVVAALEEGIVVAGADGRVQAGNAAAERILHVEPGELVGQRLSTVLGPMVDERGVRVPLHNWPGNVTLRTGTAQKNVVMGRLDDGATTWISINSVALSSSDGRGRTVVCSLSDITDAKLSRDQLTYVATHDMLTNLANRAGIANYLSAFGDDRTLAVLFIDLDRFKTINDSMGHGAGDAVLRQVAERLLEGVRADDVVGRLAGDEFVILCPGMCTRRMATSAARRLLARLDQPMIVADANGAERHVTISASVGIAFVKRGETAADVLVDADVAMYLAKQRGRSRVEVFDDSLRVAARERRGIRVDLGTVIEEGGLDLAYQPIVDRAGAVKGYEALVRWTHPTRGVVPPAEFIPIAEETGLIGPLGSWVLAEAASAAATWRAGRSDLYLAVNLSARQLSDPDLVSMVARVLTTAHLAGDALCLEITESSVMTDPEGAAVILGELKALGVMLAIDDFGTGYSSLAYLRKFPVDVLKVDQSFVSGLDGGPDAEGARSIVVAIVSLAHALGLSVIAEGVETAAQADILRALEVDGLQGYLYGRPGPGPSSGRGPG